MFDTQNLIVNFLSTVPTATITNYVIYILLFVFISGLFCFSKKKLSGLVNGTTSILTSIGILGTFIGIVVGLVGFDTSDIDKSIPILLDGLKVAFISSFVGVFLSILFKLILSFTPKDDVNSELDNLMSGLKRIEDAIAKDDGKSIYSQFRLFRSDYASQKKLEESKTQELSDKLWRKFDDFTEMLSESASKQIIQALENVILDFNNNLKEQFGENFKQLNEAVKELINWQENYKNQIADMIQQYQFSLDSIKKTEEAIKSIQENTHSITKTSEQLKSVIEINNHQINDLADQLQAFSTIKDKAIDAMPIIEESLSKLTQEIKKTTEEAQSQVSKIDKALAKEIEEKLSEMGSALGSITRKFTSDYQDLVREMQNVISQR